ncbi:MAG: S8 family serine peptidase, partial [Muribaculaceae bacterium]|nr:S8 family serine peptidase [Muribaculaceae bacterium]
MNQFSTFKALAASALMLTCSFGAIAQDRNNDDEVVKLDARSSRFNYLEGEIIVKFKPSSLVNVRSLNNGRFSTTGIKTLDAKLNALGLFEAEPLMPLSGGTVSTLSVKSLSGQKVVDNDMSKLYRLKFDTAKLQSVDDAITQIKSMAEVEYAEPNYLVYTLATDADVYSLDPLYSQQWGFDAINLPALWAMPKISDKRPVIAILDTGVEFTHLDLLNNIWTNEAEFSGATGTDDDGNGYADDMYGWDFVNQNNRMDDYNGHGTHCAGIAAAVGGNGNGGVGANPDVLIMPIAVLQSDGAGDIATLVKGIDYATANGADILSLSLGTYASSIALEQALAKAYQNAVIVAAAGNDNLCINPHVCGNPPKAGAPMYPAAYTFVLGVQATDKSGSLASFSNYDCDGPLFSNPDYFTEEQLYNYELKAPGVSVMSTYPGGRYRALNGTSMACPLVAGAISRLLQCKEYASKEILFGDLIHAANGGNVNMLATYNITDADRKPNLRLVTYELNDTTGGDGDYRADAGETLEIYPTLRNDWGQAENIKISIDFGENEDLSIAQFIANNVDFGKPLSSYAKAKSANPIRIKLRDEIADGRRIKFVLKATCDNMEGELTHEFTVKVENGVEIGGMVTEDLTLYPAVHYIVTKSIAAPYGVKLTIKPGTVLNFKAGTGMSFSGGAILDCVGTPDSMITFTMADGETGVLAGINGNSYRHSMRYVNFNYLHLKVNVHIYDLKL